jgi:hypothetical protein
MSQNDILRMMKKNRWYSSKQVAPIVKINFVSACKNFRSLEKFKLVHNLDSKRGKRNQLFLRKKGNLYL